MSVSPTIAVQSDYSPDEDASLVLAAQKNPALFQALYDRWAKPVYKYFFHRTGEITSAEDLTSQLFLAAYQSLPRYQHRGHFAAWLFTIARNLLKATYRKKQREVSLDIANQVASLSDPAAETVRADEIERLKNLIRTLPEEESELIRLRYVAELTFGEMAIVLNKREDAVKKSLYRLQARMQSLLEQEHA